VPFGPEIILERAVMISLHRIEAAVPSLCGLGVLIVAVSAFILSYTNLTAQAIESGIPPLLAPLWAINLDAFLIIGTLFILRTSLRGESTKAGWCVVILFTIISSVFNVIHAPPDIVGRFAHLIPPIALCVSLEFAMLILKSELNRQGETVAKEVAKLPLEQPRPAAKMAKDVAKPEPTAITANHLATVTTYLANHPAATASEVAKATGLSRSTARYHMAKLPQPVNQEAG